MTELFIWLVIISVQGDLSYMGASMPPTPVYNYYEQVIEFDNFELVEEYIKTHDNVKAVYKAKKFEFIKKYKTTKTERKIYDEHKSLEKIEWLTTPTP